MTHNNQSKNGGKRAIVRDVMAKGFSARKAAKAVDSVVDLMKQALSYHEPVELPGLGTFEVVIQKGRPRRRRLRVRNIATEQVEIHDVTFPGRRYLVKLRPYPNLNLPTDPAPPSRVAPPKPTIEPDRFPAIKRIATVVHAYRGGVRPVKSTSIWRTPRLGVQYE